MYKRKNAQEIAAEAYQIIGVLADECGVFEDDAVQEALDYFSDIYVDESVSPEFRNGQKEILPWGLKNPPRSENKYRKAQPEDIFVGQEVYVYGMKDIIIEVLKPDDPYKAYVGADGCRYGLETTYVSVESFEEDEKNDLSELQRRIQQAQDAIDQLPDWMKQNLYFVGGENLRKKE